MSVNMKEEYNKVKAQNQELLAQIAKAINTENIENPHWGNIGDEVWLRESLVELRNRLYNIE